MISTWGSGSVEWIVQTIVPYRAHAGVVRGCDVVLRRVAYIPDVGGFEAEFGGGGFQQEGMGFAYPVVGAGHEEAEVVRYSLLFDFPHQCVAAKCGVADDAHWDVFVSQYFEDVFYARLGLPEHCRAPECAFDFFRCAVKGDVQGFIDVALDDVRMKFYLCFFPAGYEVAVEFFYVCGYVFDCVTQWVVGDFECGRMPGFRVESEVG